VKIAALMLALSLGQTSSDPYVRSRVAAGDPTSQCLFWTVPKITYYQSTAGNPETKPAGSEFGAIDRSFQSWQVIFTQCGSLTFEAGGHVDDRKVGYVSGGDNRNLVLFRPRRCADVAPSSDACWNDSSCNNAYDCWDNDGQTIAVTLTTYDEKSGIIYDSDIELNAAGFFFTTSDGPLCNPPLTTTNCVSTDVQNTVTHEIGHFIGLDHTNALGSVMNPRAPPGEISKRTIDSGSASYVCAAYPKGQPGQGCIHVASDPNLGKKAQVGGCSSVGAEAWLPSLAGWALLLARRRRGARS
jgi:matrixin